MFCGDNSLVPVMLLLSINARDCQKARARTKKDKRGRSLVALLNVLTREVRTKSMSHGHGVPTLNIDKLDDLAGLKHQTCSVFLQNHGSINRQLNFAQIKTANFLSQS